MARVSGKNGSVSVGGSTISFTTGWSMRLQQEMLEHRGASESQTTTYLGEGRWQGQFAVEADASNALHASLMTAQRAALVLYEDGGVSYSITAIVTPGVNVPRGGKVTRTFDFIQTA